ncbi:MBL fold metallo-hydrolase [Acidobacteriota bacterium]
MEYTFLGVRGSTPASGRNYNKYGGHTSCSLVQIPGKEKIIVDTGTGIIGWGNDLIKNRGAKSLRISILLTHFHLDHLMGLLFFSPLYSSSAQITFYSFLSPKGLEKCLSNLMGGRYFPVKFMETPSKKVFRKILPGRFRIGGIQISHFQLNHPQGALAYKFQDKQKSIVLATDTEHPEDGIDEGLEAFAHGTDYLIYDAMLTPLEYKAGKQGWGHSTWKEGTKLAEKGKVGHLVLSHFNPDHSDRKIDQILSQSKKKFQKTIAAKERLKIIL